MKLEEEMDLPPFQDVKTEDDVSMNVEATTMNVYSGIVADYEDVKPMVIPFTPKGRPLPMTLTQFVIATSSTQSFS